MDWNTHNTDLRHPRSWYSQAVLLILMVFIILGVVYSVVNPIFEAPDEVQHFFYVTHLAEGNGLPLQDPAHPALWAQEGSQPPLYYTLAALLLTPLDTSKAATLLWKNDHAALGDPLYPLNKNYLVHTDQEAWPYRGAVLAVHVVRLFSVLLGAVTLVFLYLLVRTLLPRAPRLAVATTALTAFTPQFIFISSAVSNDNLITMLSTITAWLTVYLARQSADALQDRMRMRRWWAGYVALGLLLGAAALAKLSGAFLWVLAGGVLMLFGIRQRMGRRTLGGLSVAFVIAIAIAGWWYVRNWRLYDDPTGLKVMLAIVGGWKIPLGWRDLVGQFQGLRISYWALFGWFNVLLPDWVYRVLDGIALVALLGLPLIFRRGEREITNEDRVWLLAPVAWIFVMLAGLVRWTLLTPGMQGRLLYPAAWAINLLLVLGWSRWSELFSTARWPRLRFGWLAVPAGLLFLLVVISPGAVIAPTYRKPMLIAPAKVPISAQIAPVTFGTQARLIGARISPETARPGETAWVTLYWEVLERFDRDYTVFVQLQDHAGRTVTQETSWPGLGAYPTRLWKPGTIVVDRYPVSFPVDAVTPSLLKIKVGFFIPYTDQGLLSRSADGSATPDVFGKLRLLPDKVVLPDPSVPIEVRLGVDGIRLLGYDLVVGAQSEGQPIEVTLYWKADRSLTQDYTVFVHLRRPDGTNLVQRDRQPLAGAWPTWAWEPDQPVVDRYTLSVPAGTPPGRYTLWAGMYRLADLTRLPLSGAGLQTRDDALFLGEVVIRND